MTPVNGIGFAQLQVQQSLERSRVQQRSFGRPREHEAIAVEHVAGLP
jgi:hypothetical protein